MGSSTLNGVDSPSVVLDNDLSFSCLGHRCLLHD